MDNKLHYEDLPDQATEFRGDFSFIKQRRREWLKNEFEKLSQKEKEALFKEMGLDEFAGCYCCD